MAVVAIDTAQALPEPMGKMDSMARAFEVGEFLEHDKLQDAQAQIQAVVEETHLLSPEQVSSVEEQVRPHLIQTPVLQSSTISSIVSNQAESGIELFFKCENLQKTGSFKYRGALNSISQLSDEQLCCGVCTTSSGNHGKAMALAAREVGAARGLTIPVSVVMPKNATPSKIKTVQALGATVVCSEPAWAERTRALAMLSATTGAALISAEASADILLGQGTVGPELAQQVRAATAGAPLDAVLAPCGSGGLLSGLAVALKGSGTKVFGVEPAKGGADDAARGRRAKRRITSIQPSSIADGLRCPVGKLAWEIVRRPELVEDVFSVSEAQIAAAMRVAFEELKMVIEPSAAVGLAAALYNPGFHRYAAAAGQKQGPFRVGVVLTGGNVSLDGMQSILG